MQFLSNNLRKKIKGVNKLNEEFDPGSGWTLTECLTHASQWEDYTL